MAEADGLPSEMGVNNSAFVIEQTAVAIGFLNRPSESVPLHRAPSATAFDAIGCEFPRAATHQHHVGLAAHTQEAAFLDAEDARRIVAHQAHHIRKPEHPFVHQAQHGRQRELNHRHAGHSRGRTALLFAQQMGGMVSADG